MIDKSVGVRHRIDCNLTVALVCALAFGLATARPAAGTNFVVTRGPYLQSGSASEMTVRWRTDAPTDALVRFGTTLGNLNLSQAGDSVTTEHVVRITGLDPDTKYFYSVGNGAATISGGDATHFFRTSPATGTPKPTRIWVLGDSGTSGANAAAVRDAWLGFTAEHGQELWLMLGNNAFNSGTDLEFQSGVFDFYPTVLRNTPLWPTFGNRDGVSADSATQTGPYYDIFTLPKNGQSGGLASGTEAFYSFDYGNVHFICLDSHETSRSPAGAMMTWLAADLAAADGFDWIVAFWHHPPYTKGSHDSDSETQLAEMRENALPILEAHGVDLVLAGHSQSYERSFLLDGHYGLSFELQPANVLDSGNGDPDGDGAYVKPSAGPAPHEGTVYAVAGSGGALGGGTLDHPAMVVSLNQLGSMALDFEGRVLFARFVNGAGVITDQFRIVKGDSGLFVDGFNFGDACAWTAAVGGSC